jgi:thioredoxin reductase
MLFLPPEKMNFNQHSQMATDNFEVIIIGGSYSGLAAGMALGRALRKVLIIDSGKPCNRFTPHSHNFLTHDGNVPGEIAALARRQVGNYNTVTFFDDLALRAEKKGNLFYVSTATNRVFTATKLIFATGIRDVMPDIPGFEDCWGKSSIHCPYCHGYEVRGERTGILGNGEYAFEFAALISNWTKDLSVYTNGLSTLTGDQREKLIRHNIDIVEDEVERLEHANGYLKTIVFRNGRSATLKALYSRPLFVQHSDIPESLGCELTVDGYLKVDSSQKTTIPSIFACGDNTTRMRTVANAVAMGTTAGMMVNKELILEVF